jgi:hypothetical protein
MIFVRLQSLQTAVQEFTFLGIHFQNWVRMVVGFVVLAILYVLANRVDVDDEFDAPPCETSTLEGMQ